MKIGQNIIVNLTAKTGTIRLRMPFGAAYSVPPLNDAQLAQMAALAKKRTESLHEGSQVDPSLTFDQVNPQDADFIYPSFRALSKTLITDYFIDFSKDNVVQDAVGLFQGQTVYSNHVYWRVENWLGAISKAEWDANGEKTGGVPGINVELKIDWKSNPKIARGLLMKPPAIHSVSATVIFDWDASHPELLEQGIFWRNLGQEIEGSIVRILVTKITAVYELSLVYMGANPESNGHLTDDEEEPDEGLSAPPLSAAKPPPLQLAKSKETKKMKFNAVLIAALAALGITIAPEEEVAEDRVQTLLSDLSKRAAAADPIVAAERAEVLRLATIAEGTGEGDQRKLPESLSAIINGADPSQLSGLRGLYAERAEAKFTKTCQDCGSKNVANRSSVEAAQTVTDQTAQVQDTNLL